MSVARRQAETHWISAVRRLDRNYLAAVLRAMCSDLDEDRAVVSTADGSSRSAVQVDGGAPQRSPA